MHVDVDCDKNMRLCVDVTRGMSYQRALHDGLQTQFKSSTKTLSIIERNRFAVSILLLDSGHQKMRLITRPEREEKKQ
jgi:hypothetical protein